MSNIPAAGTDPVRQFRAPTSRGKYALYTFGVWAAWIVCVFELATAALVGFVNPDSLEGELFRTTWQMHAWFGLCISYFAQDLNDGREQLIRTFTVVDEPKFIDAR